MAEAKRDYYEVLGVSKDADDATIKKAFAGIINQHFYFMCWLFIRFL